MRQILDWEIGMRVRPSNPAPQVGGVRFINVHSRPVLIMPMTSSFIGRRTWSAPPQSIRCPSPVDNEAGAGNEGRGVGREVEDRPKQILNTAQPAQLDLGQYLCAKYFILEERRSHRCLNEGGRNRVGADAMGREIEGHRLAHALQPPFRGAVERSISPADMSHLRPDMDKAAVQPSTD